MARQTPSPALHTPCRKPVFMETGLVNEETARMNRTPALTTAGDSSAKVVCFRSRNRVVVGESKAELADDALPSTPSWTKAMIPRWHHFVLLTAILAAISPLCQMGSLTSVGVQGGLIPTDVIEDAPTAYFQKRQDDPTQVCKRWSGQSAIVNGTLYMYGFRSSTDAKQESNTWTNDLLSLDLKNSWQIASPSLTAPPKPSGPPAVSLGYLWSSQESLFLYGGQFSDNPVEEPGPNSIWEYSIANQDWIEHKDPRTSAGDNAEGDDQSIQRAAEGAGFSVAALGRAWYFGGHLDNFTTPGWDTKVPRLYLKSLLEFTMPGRSNEAVDQLKGGKTAGKEGVFRNVTKGGLQGTGSFPERADGVLVYVPGFTDSGILVGLSGGDNDTFTQMNVVDVYDIAKSEWYKQSTSGTVPKYRVNPCAVVGAAADGSSYNTYMFGGQNLQPAKDQTQYDDMWILSVPSFTWIEVDQSNQSIPPARAGHSCHAWDGQLIVLGGYVSKEISCDAPGIYVFNMSSLSWSDQFTALTGDNANHAWNGKDNDPGNSLAQHANQRGYDAKAGVEGSYGYRVPSPVQQVIGGQATGGATLTAPVQTPTNGPFKTGTPYTYTVTGPDGATITQTVNGGSGGPRGLNVGAIVAGVVAGIFFVIAAYFAFCAWVYRKQVRIWKQHVVMMTARNTEKNAGPALDPLVAGVAGSTKVSSERAQRDILSTRSSAGGEAASMLRTSDEQTAYAGATGDTLARRDSADSDSDDLLAGQEPTFWGSRGVLLNPRRSLRVINRD